MIPIEQTLEITITKNDFKTMLWGLFYVQNRSTAEKSVELAKEYPYP